MLLWLLASCSDYGLKDRDSEVLPKVTVTEQFFQEALPNIDILFVIDGTGSMAEEQANLGTASTVFIERLQTLGLRFQIGVISSDLLDAGALQGRPWIITATANAPVAALTEALQVGTDHLSPSAGFEAALLALSADNYANIGFRRSDAALHVIFVSDADDESASDQETVFIDWMQSEAQRTGHTVRASALAGDLPSGCAGAGGQALPGHRYAAVVDALGGQFLSICTSDFSTLATVMGEEGVEWQRIFHLQALPDARSVVVEVNGVRSTDWVLQGQDVVFDLPPPPAAELRVQYVLGAP